MWTAQTWSPGSGEETEGGLGATYFPDHSQIASNRSVSLGLQFLGRVSGISSDVGVGVWLIIPISQACLSAWQILLL